MILGMKLFILLTLKVSFSASSDFEVYPVIFSDGTEGNWVFHIDKESLWLDFGARQVSKYKTAVAFCEKNEMKVPSFSEVQSVRGIKEYLLAETYWIFEDRAWGSLDIDDRALEWSPTYFISWLFKSKRGHSVICIRRD